MLEYNVTYNGPDIETMLAKVSRFAGTVTDDVISREIGKGNDEYAIAVDGRPVGSRDAMHSVKRRIVVTFASRTVELAIDVAIAALARMVTRHYKIGDSTQAAKMASRVTAWHHIKGGPTRQITSGTGVKMAERDYISLTVRFSQGEHNTIPVANWLTANIKGSKEGFYKKAARSIRRKVKSSRTTGAVSVSAQRLDSPRTYQPYVGKYKTTGARPIPEAIATKTSWMIIIRPRYRSRSGGVVRLRG